MALIFRKNKSEVLLTKRQNTGYMDDLWDCTVCGHVEENNSMKDTIVIEAKEELGIEVLKEDLKFAAFTHLRSETAVYFYVYFVIKDYKGKIEIKEPEKCSELEWFNVEDLPKNMIKDRRKAIKEYLKGKNYNEFGWD
jgi:8-oxo-dGTP pyrophosphatase MutT (NUDIX family)